MTVIGVVTTSYPRHEDDFAGGFVRARVRSLARAGARIEVIAAGAVAGPDPRSSEPGVSVWRVAADDLFYSEGAPEALSRGGAAWASAVGFIARLVEAVRARAPAWARVESHWLVPTTAAVTLAAPRLPHEAFAHSGDVALLERLPGGDALARRLLSRGVRVTFASADLRRRLAARVGGTLAARTLHMPVEAAPSPLERLCPPTAAQRLALRRRLGFTGPTVLGVGRLVPIKGYDLLVRGVSRLTFERRPRVVVLGEGPERSSLRLLAERRGVDLHLPGAATPASVVEHLQAADLFVHPARALYGRTEGSPLVIREALSAGLRVVASETGGIPELAGCPGLTLVRPECPGALSNALSELVGHP